jgi:HlyD family secretion protein
MTLQSPIDGSVTSRSTHSGEAALAGATLLTVANLDEVKLTVYIPEDELGRVYLGQGVEVQVDSFPGRVFTGTVSYISQQAEFTPKNVQTEEERVNMVFAVRVRLPNPDHALKPGMPADAIFTD